MRRNNKHRIILISMLLIILFSIEFFITKKHSYEKKENLHTEEQDNNYEEILERNNNASQNNSNTMEVIVIPEKEVNSYTTDWDLILVNKNNKIPENYEVNLSNIENNHKVDSRIAEALKSMLEDARKEELNPIICSSYRTSYKQTQLYNNKIKQFINKGYSNEKAREVASYWVAIPNTSEHQTGLAVDIVSKSYQVLDDKQEKTEVQKWLIENSYKYGFILRYPIDKKDITMINYEPWHYRYVGVENAKYMKKNGICLEEYIDYLKQFEQNLV